MHAFLHVFIIGLTAYNQHGCQFYCFLEYVDDMHTIRVCVCFRFWCVRLRIYTLFACVCHGHTLNSEEEFPRIGLRRHTLVYVYKNYGRFFFAIVIWELFSNAQQNEKWWKFFDWPSWHYEVGLVQWLQWKLGRKCRNKSKRMFAEFLILLLSYRYKAFDGRYFSSAENSECCYA